jgi:hypothetical protein
VFCVSCVCLPDSFLKFCKRKAFRTEKVQLSQALVVLIHFLRGAECLHLGYPWQVEGVSSFVSLMSVYGHASVGYEGKGTLQVDELGLRGRKNSRQKRV